MAREMTEPRSYFRNDEAWTIGRRFIGDLWIEHITASFNRIHGGKFIEIHPCKGFRIEIFQGGGHIQAHNVNLGGLKLGMFSRALRYEDIERMGILYRNGTPDLVYFPYKDKTDESLDNIYQSTKVSEKTKSPYIVINPTQIIDDIYTKELK